MTTTYFTHDSFDAISGFSMKLWYRLACNESAISKSSKGHKYEQCKNPAICVSCTSGRSNRAAVRFSTSGRFGF